MRGLIRGNKKFNVLMHRFTVLFFCPAMNVQGIDPGKEKELVSGPLCVSTINLGGRTKRNKRIKELIGLQIVGARTVVFSSFYLLDTPNNSRTLTTEWRFAVVGRPKVKEEKESVFCACTLAT